MLYLGSSVKTEYAFNTKIIIAKNDMFATETHYS